MIKRLIQNTIISTIAFGAAALLGLIVIPVIIRTWGVTEFGLIVITRLLLPTGMMAVLDLGLSEVATQAVARAQRAPRLGPGEPAAFVPDRLSICAGTGPERGDLARNAISHGLHEGRPRSCAGNSSRFCTITALANLVLVPALVWEGIVKGFERYNLLRISEFASTLGLCRPDGLGIHGLGPFRNRRLHLSCHPRARALAVLAAHHHRAGPRRTRALRAGRPRFGASCCIDACCCCRAS